MPCPTTSSRRRIPGAALMLPFAALLLIFHPRPAAGQWRLEAWFGDAWSVPTRVSFFQRRQPVLDTTAHWSTRPFRPTWYYSGRIAKWSDSSAWAFEYMHHKIYLDNPPAGVRTFRVTNGVNFLLAERLWRRAGWEFGGGVGPVFAVPVSSVRDKTYNGAHGIFHSKYELAGFGLQANVARRVRLIPWVYGTFSLKATFATLLHLTIADGYASTVNLALHAQYGISLQSGR